MVGLFVDKSLRTDNEEIIKIKINMSMRPESKIAYLSSNLPGYVTLAGIPLSSASKYYLGDG